MMKKRSYSAEDFIKQGGGVHQCVISIRMCESCLECMKCAFVRIINLYVILWPKCLISQHLHFHFLRGIGLQSCSHFLISL